MDYPYVDNNYWYTGNTGEDSALGKLKILIGTSIHESKDYAMERWLENVFRLQKEYPADLFMVDTSLGMGYMEKVKGYCAKIGIQKYKIEHIDIGQFQPFDEKVGRSRERIRQEVLNHGYDAWLSWECDMLVPADALKKIAAVMGKGRYMMVHAYAKFGFSLVKRECLEKYGFSLDEPDMPNCWTDGEEWFKKRVLKGGGNYVEIFGGIGPISRLNNPSQEKAT